MRVTISSYLAGRKEMMRRIISALKEDFAYVSILGTDTYGKQYTVQKTSTSLKDSLWSERGFVVRVHNGVNYSECSFNQITEDVTGLIAELRTQLTADLDLLKKSDMSISSYPFPEEEEMQQSYFAEVEKLPSSVSTEEKIRLMTSLKDHALTCSDLLVDFRVVYEEVHVSKIFLSTQKDLEQSFIWAQGRVLPIVRRGENTQYYPIGFSGLKGVELLDEMQTGVEESIEKSILLLDAKPPLPGEYEVICDPEVTGVIAHESFGHGVEMDMFVKNRAKAMEFIDQPIASELVTMYDGATALQHVGSYLFDDEGTPGTNTVIIEQGIFKTGISDLLSALRLKTLPTGNGRRESFERKAYARMTNTIFAPGQDRLEDMIASIKHGYLLEGISSGMEDPKNWGIQVITKIGREIKDGKLTDNYILPAIITGYVPDVLRNISMVSQETGYSGLGACGKGIKELVKVSDGGPYIKTRVRLG